MTPIETLRADWDTFHAALRKTGNFNPACDTCTHSACCYEPVYSDQIEVDDILSRLTPEQRSELIEAVHRWHKRATLSGVLLLEEKGAAFPYRDASLPCPFLKDGRCSIYEHRPLACRAHYALANPDNCKMPARRTQKYAMWEQNDSYLNILMKYALAVGLLKIDHLGLQLYNRLFGANERSSAASQYIIEKGDA